MAYGDSKVACLVILCVNCRFARLHDIGAQLGSHTSKAAFANMLGTSLRVYLPILEPPLISLLVRWYDFESCV